MSYSLCLSLGHNSSAVLIENGKILCGYENERLTGIKSDSQFPTEAILEIRMYYNLNDVTNIYISHWGTYGLLSDMSYKHWRPDILSNLCPNGVIACHVDHHDCHVAALRAFAGKQYKWEIVADGFGNYNEVISIYYEGKLVKRCFGFNNSLGLLYQYTTAYLGFKMNQDEYKLLGYEAHIKDILTDQQISFLIAQAKWQAKKLSNSILSENLDMKYDLVAGLEALPNTRIKIHTMLDNLLYTKLKIAKYDNDVSSETVYNKRVIVAFFVQYVVETVMATIITSFNMKEVALTGGLFMNVKLNNSIAKLVYNICVMPICGDQSGGIGSYNHHKKDLVWPEHLFWAKRNLNMLPKNVDRLMVTNDYLLVKRTIMDLLDNDNIVNFVTGNGEFGARALCHTTTFALPTIDNVKYINTINDRSTIMPMAGVMSVYDLRHYKDYDKVLKSLEYMIMTLDYKGYPHSSIIGCHHKHPIEEIWTNRVQVLPSSTLIGQIVRKFGLLINTSFNIHGQPIVLLPGQIMDAHFHQISRDVNKRVHTIILTEGNNHVCRDVDI